MNIRGLGALRPRTGSRSATWLVTAAVTTSLLSLGTATHPAPATAAPATAMSGTAVVAGSVITMSPDSYERRVHRVVNLRREALGLRALGKSACAAGTAGRWASHLALTDVLYHQSMSVVLRTCDASYAGETLGRGTMTPRQLVKMWMRSPDHRAILLSRKPRRVGIGASPDALGRYVVAANFVRP